MAKEDGGESEAQKQADQAHQGRQITSDEPKPSEPLTDDAVDLAASSVRLATTAARHKWNKVLVRPKLRAWRIPSCTRRAMRCSTTWRSLSSFVECRTGLQLARLLKQDFLRVDLHRPSASTRVHCARNGHTAQVSVAKTNIPPPPLTARRSRVVCLFGQVHVPASRSI